MAWNAPKVTPPSPGSLPAAGEGVTAVIHLAAVFRTRDDDQTWTVNREGTRNLIAAVQQHAPDARFLLASTSNVYDADSPHPGREDDTTVPTLAYPPSKIEAENLLRASQLTWGVLRLPFIYGDQDGHLESLPELRDIPDRRLPLRLFRRTANPTLEGTEGCDPCPQPRLHTDNQHHLRSRSQKRALTRTA